MNIDDRRPVLNEPISGRISSFGGPNDKGVTETEGLALYEKKIDPRLFLMNEEGMGLARSLNPEAYYCAMRWDYEQTPKAFLLGCLVLVEFARESLYLSPCDWGPNQNTGRIIDVSPRAMRDLGCQTDDIVTCTLIKNEL